MASQVDICNAALVKLAQDIPIAAMSETSKAARAFNRCWDSVRDQVLAEHPWPWSVKAVALALDTEDPTPGWEYRYTYPDDCLTALGVCSEAGVRAGISRLTRRDEWAMQVDGRVSFDVVYGEQSTGIVADQEDAYLIYASRVTETPRYPPLFVDALACRLALEVAPALAGELGLRMGQKLREDYEISRSKAIAHGFNESRELIDVTTPSRAARGGY